MPSTALGQADYFNETSAPVSDLLGVPNEPAETSAKLNEFPF